MSEYVYRFRPIKRILKCKELEKQEIYFADPKELNDPLEGFPDVFWKGDEILWKNLFKNYLLCLQYHYLFTNISNGHCSALDEPIKVFSIFDHLPPKYQEKMQRVFVEFFSNKNIVSLIKYILGKKQVRIKDLILYLKRIHLYCTYLITKHDDMFEVQNKFSKNMDNYINNLFCRLRFFELFKIIREKNKYLDNLVDIISKAMKDILSHSHFVNGDIHQKNKWFYLFDFSSNYVKKLEHLMFCSWYTASFSKNYTNHKMWRDYASEYQGICLKFKLNQEKQNNTDGLLLSVIKTNNGDTKRSIQKNEYHFPELHSINYDSKTEPIDFFRSIGRLPRKPLISQWYSNNAGEISHLVEDIVEDILKEKSARQKKHWKQFYSNVLSKTEKWSHEEEKRLVHMCLSGEPIEKQDRHFRYNFEDLEEIIFGSKTSDTEKMKMFEIIRHKCDESLKAKDVKAKKTNFEFSQADYDVNTGKIKIVPLPKMTLLR